MDNPGFYFEDILDRCDGCPEFEPEVYHDVLGSGHVMNKVRCRHLNTCCNLTKYLEKVGVDFEHRVDLMVTDLYDNCYRCPAFKPGVRRDPVDYEARCRNHIYCENAGMCKHVRRHLMKQSKED